MADTSKIKELIKLADASSSNNINASLSYAQDALKLSEVLKWKKGIALSYATIGNAYYNLGQFQKALDYRLKELKLWEDLGNKKNICKTLCNIGVAYADVGNFQKALEYYKLSINWAKAIGLTEMVVSTLGNVGAIYDEQNDLEKAEEYYKKALEMAIFNKLEYHAAINYGNLASVYLARKNFTEAEVYYMKAIYLDEKNGNARNVISWYANLANVYHFQIDSLDMNSSSTNVLRATNNYDKSLTLARQLGDSYLQATILTNRAQLHLLIGKLDHARIDLEEAKALATVIQDQETWLQVYEGLYKLYKSTNNHHLALVYLERFKKLNDSLFASQHKKELSELQIKYDIEQKDAERNELLRKTAVQELSISNQRFLLFALIITTLIVLGSIFFIVRQKNLKAKSTSIILEQKLLRSQMNPHFLYNSLTNIESFIYEHQPKEAALYLAKFSRLMRLILDNSAAEYISLEKELETIEYYLSLQKLRLNDNLEYSIRVRDNIPASNILLPPMLIQPFIENSIEHGIKYLDGKGFISIELYLEKEKLIIEIIDNGIGYLTSQTLKKTPTEHQSVAIRITEERIRFLNKSKNARYSFSIKEMNKGGTKVSFSVPLIKYT